MKNSNLAALFNFNIPWWCHPAAQTTLHVRAQLQTFPNPMISKTVFVFKYLNGKTITSTNFNVQKRDRHKNKITFSFFVPWWHATSKHQYTLFCGWRIRHKTSTSIQATGDIGIQWLTVPCNGIPKEGCKPKDWKLSAVLPVYKGKGDPMKCGLYRGKKLLEHDMKVVERVFEHRITE